MPISFVKSPSIPATDTKTSPIMLTNPGNVRHQTLEQESQSFVSSNRTLKHACFNKLRFFIHKMIDRIVNHNQI